MNRAEAAFSAGLSAAGFEGEEEFLEARLEAEQRNALSAGKKDLEDRRTALAARRTDRERKLAEERARQVTDEPLEVLENRFPGMRGRPEDLAGGSFGPQAQAERECRRPRAGEGKKAALEAQGRSAAGGTACMS